MSMIVPQGILPFPVQTPIGRRPRAGRGPEDPFAGLIDDNWLKSFTSITGTVQTASRSVSSVLLTDQSGAIVTTDFPADLRPGLYRVTWFAVVIIPGGVSGQIQVTVGYTYRTVPQTYTGALMNGNLITTWQSDSKLINVDSAAPITYAIAYASVGPPTMTYDIDFVLEQVG